MRLKQDLPSHFSDIRAQALDLHQAVVSMCVTGRSIGFERSHWGLYMPEPACAAFGIVAGNPVVAELTALEFGLLQSLKSDGAQVIIETGSPRVLDLLRGAICTEPPEAQIVRRQLEVFRRVHLHLVDFNDLEIVFEPYRNVLQPLAISVQEGPISDWVRIDIQASLNGVNMSKPTSIDTVFEDVVLGQACGERESNPLMQKPFDEYRFDRNVALEWFASRRITFGDGRSVQTSPKDAPVSLAEIASAWRIIGRGLFASAESDRR